MNTVTDETYTLLNRAYSFFNDELFGGQLSPVAITLTRSKVAAGYYQTNVFASKFGDKANEIALNPDLFLTQTIDQTLSTLVHEMAHHWQEAFGKPTRNGYHNREFAVKMESLGLMCSHTGQPGGKKTGPKMTHYVIRPGAFSSAVAKFILEGGTMNWGSLPLDKASKASKKKNKVKYTCPDCDQNAWAKPEAELLCGSCSKATRKMVWMVGENTEPE